MKIEHLADVTDVFCATAADFEKKEMLALVRRILATVYLPKAEQRLTGLHHNLKSGRHYVEK